MNEEPKPRFQISLQRLLVSVAMFAVAFANVACVRAAARSDSPDAKQILAIAILFLPLSIGFPMVYLIGGWRGIGAWTKALFGIVEIAMVVWFTLLALVFAYLVFSGALTKLINVVSE